MKKSDLGLSDWRCEPPLVWHTCPHCFGLETVTCHVCLGTRQVLDGEPMEQAMGYVWNRKGCGCGTCAALYGTRVLRR